MKTFVRRLSTLPSHRRRASLGSGEIGGRGRGKLNLPGPASSSMNLAVCSVPHATHLTRPTLVQLGVLQDLGFDESFYLSIGFSIRSPLPYRCHTLKSILWVIQVKLWSPVSKLFYFSISRKFVGPPQIFQYSTVRIVDIVCI